MEEIDLRELIAMFLKKKILIILVVIIFALIGAIYTLNFITPIYQSSTTLILAQTASNSQISETTNSITASDIALNSNLVDSYKEIAQSRTVAQRVKENLGLDLTIDEIRSSTTVTTSSDTEALEITVSNTDPELACKMANELAKVFTDTATEIYKVNNVNVLDEAVVSLTPSNINLFKNIVIFSFAGLILVAGYILLINMLDTTIKTDIDIEKTVHLPVLASIVLTDENQKKKKDNGKGKRARTSIDLGYDPNANKVIQEISKMDRPKETDDNISMFSYMHKEENNQEKRGKNDSPKNSSSNFNSDSKKPLNQRKKKKKNNNRKDIRR